MTSPASRAEDPPPAHARRLRAGAVAAVVTLLALAAFANALRGEFLYDDLPYVVHNPQVQQPDLGRLVVEPLSGRAELGLYRPLPLVSYALQARGRGAHAPTLPFHLFNAAVHALVALLVWRFALRLGLSGLASAAAAALFAVHPCHVEAVDWIVGRAELLAALFGLAFLLVALSPADTWRPRRTLLAAACLFCACLSKESAFALPGVLAAVEFGLGRRETWRAWLLRQAPWVAVLLLVAGVRYTVLGRFAPDAALAPYHDLPWYGRPLLSLQLLGEYFRRGILPTPPRIFFHATEFTRPALSALLGLVAYALALAFSWRRSRSVRAALLAFPVALIPVLNLRPIQETFAERFLYLPSVFVAVALGALVALPADRERAARGTLGLKAALPAAAVLALLPFTWLWNPVFADASSLWQHNLRLAPDLPFVHYQAAYFQHSRKIYTPRDPETVGAVREYERALELHEQMVARGERGMPVDQRIRAHLALGSIFLDELPVARRDARRARNELERAQALGEQFRELDPELGRACWLLAQLRHVADAGVSTEQARTWLVRATQLELAAPLAQAVREDLARVEQELAGNQ